MSTSSWESYLTPQEQQFFNKCFRAASRSQSGLVTGPEAVRFFATSGVPNQILSDIWETADRDNQGYLTPETFSIALKLIACTQHGKDPQNPVLSTSVPLPQFEGLDSEAPAAASPHVGAAAAAAAHGPAMTITPEEREKYYSIFRVHQPAGGFLDGESAKNIFMKSKLPNEALGQIWNLADVRQTGNLNQAEFAIAMHYIAKLMDGTISTLPSQLPPSVYATAAGDNNPVQPTQQPQPQQPQQQLPQRSQTIDSLGSLAFSSSAGVDQQPNQQQWNITPQEKIQFDAFFDKIDTKRTGFVQGTDAVEFFTNSRLPEADLAQIWDLADSSQQGRLSRDQFAVAMHLIHKRLRGEPLPTTLPNALALPQGASPAMAPAVAAHQSPAMVHHQPAVQSPLATNTSPFENQDLLGDFGDNEQLTQDTNQVNQLQNQMAALKTSTGQVQHQKMDAQQTLEQLAKQKKELQAQLAQVQLAHETEVKELQELQQQVENERPGWMQAQQEHDAAQQQLIATQNEIAQLQQTLETSRTESEQLRKRVHEIQDETAQLTTQLNNLRSQLKQQDMMLDINRRQVTASEQDRDQAKRDLEDFKEERQLSDDVVEAAKPKPKESEAQKSPQAAAASSPANTSSNLFDLFTAKPTDKDEGGKKEGSSNDFDAIFGNIQSSKPTSPATQSSPFSPFDPVGWATPPEPTTTSSPPNTTTNTTRAARPAPPPPPPQSRHHRNTSDASHTTASTTTSITKKPRAPPPPPPTAAQKSTEKADNEFDSAFMPSTTTATTTSPPPVDDFDAAFSGQMSNAQVVQAGGNDFDGFDDAFASFDKEAKPSETKKTNTSDLNWASNFGGFDFAEGDTKGAGNSNNNKEDDWDSIFGGSNSKNTSAAAAATTTTATSGVTENKADNNEKNVFGFEDAFSSSGFAPAAPAKQELALSGDNSNLDELMKMGFERKQAKEALDRYDQDLVKASNFLLDQSSK